MGSGNKIKKLKKEDMRCLRCGGRMIFEKFFDINNAFFGWHCVICGEILDPVILLHRLSQDAGLQIPEEEKEVMNMLKKYLHAKPKAPQGKEKGKELGFGLSQKEESRLN